MGARIRRRQAVTAGGSRSGPTPIKTGDHRWLYRRVMTSPVDRFLGSLAATERGPEATWARRDDYDVDDLIGAFGGTTFEQGLYRIHTSRTASDANALVGEAFSQLARGIACFAYDWLGRQFAVDRRQGSANTVLLADAGRARSWTRPHISSRFTIESSSISTMPRWRVPSSGLGRQPTRNPCLCKRTSASDIEFRCSWVERTSCRISKSLTAAFTGSCMLNSCDEFAGCPPELESAASTSDSPGSTRVQQLLF
jgi:hypothetical protein